MEMAVLTKRCCFQWDICNSFLPRESLEATFYFGIITEYPWKVIFESMNRAINHREFVLTLAYNVRFDTPPETIVARGVEVTILYGDDPVEWKSFGDIRFSRNNRYRYRFQETVVTGEIKLRRKLSIKVEFQMTEERIRYQYYYDYIHLLQLSEDMKKVLISEENTDLILWSAYNRRPFNVHSYIINFRWSNFFKVHHQRDEVETNISENLLSDIITYMYCGDFPSILPFMRDPQYIAELGRVVDRYKLEHLYKVLVKNDLMQHRMTFTDTHMVSHLFPLNIVENRAVNHPSYTWVVNPNFGGRYEIDFRMHVGNEAGNWLSYSLESRCQSRVYVEVSLAVVKKVGGAPFPFDGRDLKLLPNQTVMSGPVLFLGCPETFGNSDETPAEYSIRCILNVSSGRRLQLLKSIDSIEYRNAQGRYEVLSDHMRQLLDVRTKAKMVFISLPHDRPNTAEARIIHKEIFKIRVPAGWRAIANATSRRIPDRALCNMQPYTLPCFVEYIYTGKVHSIPAVSITEIQEFADRTEMQHLKYLALLCSAQRMKRL